MQVGSSFNEDKTRRTDEIKAIEVKETPRPRVVNIIGIRVDHHCQYLLFASLKHGSVKLSVVFVLLCLQFWATTTSFILQGTLKLHVHLLVLLRLISLVQSWS